MYPDVLELRSWYAGALGRTVQNVLRKHLKTILDVPDKGQVLILGFGAPLLATCSNAVFAMPAKMGVMHVPRTGACRSLLVWEDSLPFSDNQFDAVIMLHCLEHTAAPEQVVEEAVRVLRPSGQLIAYVPNRLGLWARREKTPLAQGRPFSCRQLTTLMQNMSLTIEAQSRLLYFPPIDQKWFLKYASKIERFGSDYWLPGGGVIQVVGRKMVQHGTAAPVTKRQQYRLLPSLDPAP
jgi:SAM-dependent methyltransferase